MLKEVETLYRNGHNINQITILLLSQKEYEKSCFNDLYNQVIAIALETSYKDATNKKAC